MIFQKLTDTFKWLRPDDNPAVKLAPDDLQIHNSGLVPRPDKETTDYLWFEVTETEGKRKFSGYRVVRLLHVKFIPVEVHSDAGLLQKMRAVLRGVSGASVNLVYVAAGIFEDPPLGIVQCYGVACVSDDLEKAIADSARDLATLEAGLRGQYRQIRLAPLSLRIGRWLYSALEDMPHALVTVGHPDPHETTRANKAFQNPLAAGNATAAQLSFQQNEILYRGMASINEEFVLMVLAYSIPIKTITSMLAGYAEETSIWASQQTGVRSASFGISLPAMLSGALAEGASRNYSYGTGHATADGTAHSTGEATSTGTAHAVGHASSTGWSHSTSVSTTVTDGVSAGTSHGTSSSEGTSEGTAVSDGTSHSSGSTHTEGHSTTRGGGSSHSESTGYNLGASGKLQDIPIIGGIAKLVGAGGIGISAGMQSGTSDSSMASWSESQMSSVSTSSTSGSSHSVTSSSGTSHTKGVSDGTSQGTNHSVATSRSEGWGTSGSETSSYSDTTSSGLTNSTSDTTSRSTSNSVGESAGTGFSRSASNGLSVGVAPSFSIGNSSQWQNDPAILVTEIMRTQERLLKTASVEGAYYTDVYALARTDRGRQSLMGLIPSSFQGTEDVVTGVQCRTLAEAEEKYIRQHAQAWTPSTRVEAVAGVLSGYMDSTILTMLQLATYTAPGVFEEGAALTTQEETPQFAFFPDMPGEVGLGRQYSVEKGALTRAILRLSQGRHFHSAFVGDTGFGKTVAAERLAYETTKLWRYRTVILDFGQGWRKALDWEGLDGRVDIRQLYPGAVRPMRWNFLQVPKRMPPDRYRTYVCEMFANAGKMGPRQLGFMRRALTEAYVNAGVLVDAASNDAPEADPGWRVVKAGAEEAIVGMPAGTNVRELSVGKGQLLAAYRSRVVSVEHWLAILRKYFNELGKGDQASRTSIEGVMLRLEQFSEPSMLAQYGPGQDTIPIEDLGLLDPAGNGDQWGIAVIEGGAEMDEFAKAALFSLLATVLYADAVVRRRESLDGAKFPPMQIFFEEANKVLSGVSSGATSESGSQGVSVSAIWESMWRDGRKYSVFLHPMAQTVSQLPSGILASCANIFVFQTKNADDRDIILPHLARSEKGLVNTEYKRYLARIPRTYCVAKLGYSMDTNDLEPSLIQPIMVNGQEPSDKEIILRLKPGDGGK